MPPPLPETLCTAPQTALGACRLLVASDGMTRGMDFADVRTVVNYDMPVHVRTYIHRAGRTARAGASGRVITLLRTEHRSAFERLLREGGLSGALEWVVERETWEAVGPESEAALEALRSRLAAE